MPVVPFTPPSPKLPEVDSLYLDMAAAMIKAEQPKADEDE